MRDAHTYTGVNLKVCLSARPKIIALTKTGSLQAIKPFTPKLTRLRICVFLALFDIDLTKNVK